MKRLLRDFRHMKSVAAFLVFCLKVKHALLLLTNLSESLAALVQQYCQKVDVFDEVYHLALDGSHTQMRERDRLAQELVVLMDQLASGFESAFILDPEALYGTGFTVAQERRSRVRAPKPVIVAPFDFQVIDIPGQGKALGKASRCPGAFNQEIQINLGDPSLEENWFHKSMFHDSTNMVMDGLTPGNICFRSRHHGPEGPGPWSPVVSAPIT